MLNNNLDRFHGAVQGLAQFENKIDVFVGTAEVIVTLIHVPSSRILCRVQDAVQA